MPCYRFGHKPVAWQRPRCNGKRFYDAQADIKRSFQKELLSQLSGTSGKFIGPVRIEVEFSMPIPASYSKSLKSHLLGRAHVKKPDLSNLVKFIEDAFNGFLWQDDSQIVAINARKIYREEEGIKLWVDPVE